MQRHAWIWLLSVLTACSAFAAPGKSAIGHSDQQQIGESDALIRESMFDLENPAATFLNTDCRIYTEIAKIAAQFRLQPELRFGRIYFRQISGNGVDFGFAQAQPCTLAFSRVLAGSEVLVAYNTSTTVGRNDHVLVDATIQSGRPGMEVLYSNAGATGKKLPIANGAFGSSVQLDLQPMEFVIVK